MDIQNVIKAEVGAEHTGVLTTEGTLWTGGRNTEGEVGINCTFNTQVLMKTALNVVDFSVRRISHNNKKNGRKTICDR